MLEVNTLVSGYHRKVVVRGASLVVGEGEMVALIGHNGAGKTTMLKTIFGLLAVQGGSVVLGGEDLTGKGTAFKVRAGMSFVPTERAVFPHLTVLENLEVGSYVLRDNRNFGARLDQVYDLFPVLRERHRQNAGTLSGGEQRMVALGMALMVRPKLLLLDEPSLGLAPLLVQKVLRSIRQINQSFGTSVLLVEQNVKESLSTTDRVYVMKAGQIVHTDNSAALLQKGELWHLF